MYIKTIEIYIKIDAVDPQAAADNPVEEGPTRVFRLKSSATGVAPETFL